MKTKQIKSFKDTKIDLNYELFIVECFPPTPFKIDSMGSFKIRNNSDSVSTHYVKEVKKFANIKFDNGCSETKLLA